MNQTNQMSRIKVHRIVEYIRSRGEFPFERDDVLDDLDEVLAYYGISTLLDRDEQAAVTQELLKLAEQFEVAEVVRLTAHQLEPALRW